MDAGVLSTGRVCLSGERNYISYRRGMFSEHSSVVNAVIFREPGLVQECLGATT